MKFHYLLVAFLTIATITSCSKKDDNNQTSNCTNGIKDGNETDIDCGGDCTPCGTSRLIKNNVYLISGINDTFSRTFFYNSQGLVDSIINYQNGSRLVTVRYTYYTDSIVVTDFFYTTHLLNAQGYSASYNSYRNNSFYRADTNTYDADGHLISTNYGYSYTWSNDNLVAQNEGTAITYTYLTDKISTIEKTNMGIKYQGVGSKNLPATKSETGKPLVTFTYEYDSQNRVRKVFENGTLAQTFTYY